MTSSLSSSPFATIQRRQYSPFDNEKKLALPSYAIILIIAGGSIFILATITAIVCLVRKRSIKKQKAGNSVGSGIYAYLPNGNPRNKDEEGVGFRYEPTRLLSTVDEDDRYPGQPTHPMSSADQNRFGSGLSRPVAKKPPNYIPDIQTDFSRSNYGEVPRRDATSPQPIHASGGQKGGFNKSNRTRIAADIPPLDTGINKYTNTGGNNGDSQGSQYSAAIRNQLQQHYPPPNPVLPKPRRSSLAQSSPISPVSPVSSVSQASPISPTAQMPLIHEYESYVPSPTRQSRLQRSRGTSRYSRGRAFQSPISSSSSGYGQATAQKRGTVDYDWKNYHHKRNNTNATGRVSGDRATRVNTYTATDAIGMREQRLFDSKDGSENDYLNVASPIGSTTGYLSDEMGHSEVEDTR
ncbi:2861_t:CDS:1 [Paraglomus brasilianum]|uniref:2861_t:CDS:1 n=1 Tax=Paraglomus brasilianum TaxID=144538 RepID=A0A9N8ZAY1_9GLOM|nr:2861_t:CDS:1 [Paraglomus brasilianum]